MNSKFVPAILILTLLLSCKREKEAQNINTSDIARAEKLIGLEFSGTERDTMLGSLNSRLESYNELREYSLANAVAPALIFNPLPVGFKYSSEAAPILWPLPESVELPSNRDDLAFYSVAELSVLIRTGKITSEELTGFFLNRLKKWGDTLLCVVTLTEEVAFEQARKADREIAGGKYRGPLHGIPFGIKDLFAYPVYRTTWGAMPYKDQVINEKAEVIRRLEDAGAVIVAKLSMGALASGDVWYMGTTRNPWNLEQGSLGSSAGSASATAAGLVPFAIGTETWGSIVSPSTRCNLTGLRPTFGRVSRHGAMALTWSMDKIGPMCRNAVDCGLVFQAIQGIDEKDPSTFDASFSYEQRKDLSGLKVAYTDDLYGHRYDGDAKNDSLSLEIFRELGCRPERIHLPYEFPLEAMRIILEAESAAAFDDLTRSNMDDQLVSQQEHAWPNSFRSSRFVTAVEYIQANRIRTQLIEDVHALFREYDVIITPTEGDQLLVTNLTGHPCLVMPNGSDEEGTSTSISLIGNYFDEGILLEIARHYQMATEFEEMHPDLFR